MRYREERPHSRRGLRPGTSWTAALLVASYGVALGAVAATRGAPDLRIDAVVGPFMAGYALVAAVWSVRAGRHAGLDRRTRRGWQVMGAAFALLVVACLLFAATETLPFPTAGDAGRLLFAPVMLAGLLILPARARTARVGSTIALDIGIVVVGSGMLLWYLVLGGVLAGHAGSALVTAAAAAYPISDLALIFGAVNVLFRTAGRVNRRPLLLMAAGVVFFVAGDVYLVYQKTHISSDGYLGWQFLSWLTAHLLMALAAVDQHRRAGQPRPGPDSENRLRPVPRLPYAAVAMGYTLLLLVSPGLPMHPYGGLIIGAVAMTSLVIARQVIALKDNQQLAVTDSLTGLANRALLRHELARSLERGQRTGVPVAVLLIDLDGFKQINDTLGHEAGDEMLVAFARLLEGSVRRFDTVARLGGDEFAVVLHHTPRTGGSAGATAYAAAVAERITDAMRTPVLIAGVETYPRASIGIAVADPPHCTAGELLHRADTAMYQAKRTHRTPRDRSADLAPTP